MALVIGKTYYIKNVATGKYLNVYGTDTVANSRNVNTYAKEDCLAQKWTVGLYGSGARVYTAINSAYALNINTSNNNCTMYSAASNSEADSVVDFLTVSASNNQYRIKMIAHNKFLSVTTSDSNAYWASSADSYSLWQLEEVNSSSSIVTTAPSALVNQTFFVKNFNTGYNLNVSGYDTVEDERNVNVYSKENCLAQKWIVRQKSDGAKLCTAINENFVLNINTGTNNCTMHTESTNSSDDCVLEFIPYTDATVTASDRVYKIKMANHNRYLDPDSTGDNVNVSWRESPAYPLWQFVTEADMFPTAPAAPSKIVGSTFAIKAYGTNYNLNVHGSDTVADERNVTIYSKEDCLAQRWVVKNTAAGPKLYTKINENFALNIYTLDNNCTMHTDSVDNDNDSILEFVEVADMLYRIKLFNHNKYLCISGTAGDGANVVWAEGASSANLWEFIPEDTMFPAAAAAPGAIVGQTFFIKNFQTGYNLNVHGSDTVANSRNVNVYSKENCLAQKWQVIQTAKGPKIVTAIDPTFALNIYSEDNPNCTMYKANVSNIDTVLEFEPYTDAQVTAADKVYKIKLFHHGKYLDAEGIGSEYNVKWDETPDYPLWQFVTEEDMFPPAGNAPQSVIDKTFFLQNVNTGYFLNINGNETVSNTAQVNVYAKENVQAQRWVIRNTTAGPKMLTKLNENFALNIYAKDNNCTMYDAAVSDTDTVLEIIPYSEADNIYRIKMHYHGRYLTVLSLSIGAKAYWTAVDTEPCALWKLIPESEMTFDTAVDTDTTPDSTLVNKFIPAVAGNYMVGRNDRQISEITIHHMAGNMSIESLGAMWQNPAEGASSHYGINGLNVGQYVKECNTAYTNGGTPIDPDAESSNYRAITIEVANSVASGDYPVSEDSYRRLYELVADIARRNNLGTLVVGKNLKGHRDYSETLCPGQYLYDRLQDIADRANALNNKKYIRKFGTDKYLGIDSTNKLCWVDSDSAKPWILETTNDEYTIRDFYDTSKKIHLNDVGDNFILTNIENSNYRVYGKINSLGKFNILAENISSSFSRQVVEPIAFAPSNEEGNASPKDVDNAVIVSSTEEGSDEPESYIPPAQYKDYAFRIKHKNTDTYLSLVNLGDVRTVRLRNKDNMPTQYWTFKHFGKDVYGLVSLASTSTPISIVPENNEFILEDISLIMQEEPNLSYNELNNIGITIEEIDPVEKEYNIKLMMYDKYLYSVIKDYDLHMKWGKSSPTSWIFEPLGSEVHDGTLPSYIKPQNYVSNKVIAVNNMPSGAGYSDGYEYFPESAGMFEGTWEENNGLEIEQIIKDFYKLVFLKTDDPINNDCLYSLYGGIYYPLPTVPASLAGLPHPGVDIILRGSDGAGDKTAPIYAPCDCKIVERGTYYLTIDISSDRIPRYIMLVHMDAFSYLNPNDFDVTKVEGSTIKDGLPFVPKGTKLGYQSNKGRDDSLPVHLHIESSYNLSKPFAPEKSPGSLGDTISPYEYMEYAIDKANN